MNVVGVGKPQNGKMKEMLKSLPVTFKAFSGKAVEKFKNLSNVDIALYGAIAACVGGIIGCVFSKSFKKWLASISVLCGIGSIYLLYKKFIQEDWFLILKVWYEIIGTLTDKRQRTQTRNREAYSTKCVK